MNYIMKKDGLFDQVDEGSQPLNPDDFAKPKTIYVSCKKEQPLVAIARRQKESFAKRLLAVVTMKKMRNQDGHPG
jgi:hypothetical protein